MTDKCYAKCIYRPGAKLDESEKARARGPARRLLLRGAPALEPPPVPVDAGVPRQVHGPLPGRDGAGLTDMGGPRQAAGDGGRAGDGRSGRLPIAAGCVVGSRMGLTSTMRLFSGAVYALTSLTVAPSLFMLFMQ